MMAQRPRRQRYNMAGAASRYRDKFRPEEPCLRPLLPVPQLCSAYTLEPIGDGLCCCWAGTEARCRNA